MNEQLSDKDRAAMLNAWNAAAPVKGDDDYPAYLVRCCQATFLAGKAAGAREVREELAAATQPMTKDECLAWWAARGYRWDQTMMLFVKDEDAARVGASGGER